MVKGLGSRTQLRGSFMQANSAWRWSTTVLAMLVALCVSVPRVAGAADATAGQLQAAFDVFKNAATTEDQIRASLALIKQNAGNPALPQEVRNGAWLLPIADQAVDRVILINHFLYPLLQETLQRGRDVRNPLHLADAKARGMLSYRTLPRFAADSSLQPYPGLNEVFWTNLAKHEAEAIQLFTQGKRAQPLPADPAPVVQPQPQPVATAAPASPAAPATVSFEAGDGAEKAMKYLAAKSLVEKGGVWLLPGEGQVKAKIKEAAKASSKFSKIRREVKKLEEAMPAYDRKEAQLKKKIGEIDAHIAKNWIWGVEKEKKQKQKLLDQIAKTITPIRNKLAETRKRADAAYEACIKHLDEANELFDKVVDQYATLSEDEFIFDAAGEAGGTVGPSPQLNKQYKQLGKMRTSVERVAIK